MTKIIEIGTKVDLAIKQGCDFGPIQIILTRAATNGEFDSSVTYQITNTVSYSGAIYQAIKTSLNNLPTDTEFWAKLSNPINLATGDIRAQIRKTALSPDITANFVLTIDNLSNNICYLTLPSNITKNIFAGENIKAPESLYCWDMEYEGANNYIIPIMYGQITVFREVTR